MIRIGYIAFAAIAAIGISFFLIFVGSSLNRLYFQENPSGVAANNASRGNESQTVSLTVDRIDFNKTSSNVAKMQIAFNVHNTAHNTAILETIQYGVYLDGSKIVSGGVGSKSDDVIRGQGGLYQVLGNNSLSLEDIQTIRKSDIGENNWNKILTGNKRDYIVKGIYSIRDNSDLQDAGIDRDFELSYHYLPRNVTMNNDNLSSISTVPLKLFHTVSLPNVQGRIDHMTVDLKNQRMFIAEIENNSVDVVDLKSDQRVKTIEGLTEPQGIAYIQSPDTLIVANGGDGSVRWFDGKSLDFTGKIALSDDADNIRYDNESGLVYVGYGSGGIAIMNAGAVNRAQSVKDIKLEGHPESFQIEEYGNRIFVNIPVENSIAVVDKGKGTVIANWSPSGSQNFPLALDEGNHRLFVGTRAPAKLIIFNTDTGKEVASYDTVKDLDDISYDSTNKRVYVSGGEGFIEVLKQNNADRYSLISRIPIAIGARTSLFVPELREFFVAVPNSESNKEAALWIYSVNP